MKTYANTLVLLRLVQIASALLFIGLITSFYIWEPWKLAYSAFVLVYNLWVIHYLKGELKALDKAEKEKRKSE